MIPRYLYAIWAAIAQLLGNRKGHLALIAAVLALANAPQIRAQSRQMTGPQAATVDWEKAAGGKMSFDVASVKQNKSGPPQLGHMPTSAVPLGDGDRYPPTGALFSATNFPVISYISFAYKLTFSQNELLQPQLPRWALSDYFDIQARAVAGANPTKDQMRLMMQSLLADRFKLAIHFETRQIPVFALVLGKPGKLGSQLRPHWDDPPCATRLAAGSEPETVAGGFPTVCGNFVPMPASTTGRQRMGARNLTWGTFASLVGAMGRMDRPVVDQTGLSGAFDFILEWTPQLNRPVPDFQPDDSGPTFFEALQDQLGLKLDSQTDAVQVLVIDHVEEPSAN